MGSLAGSLPKPDSLSSSHQHPEHPPSYRAPACTPLVSSPVLLGLLELTSNWSTSSSREEAAGLVTNAEKSRVGVCTVLLVLDCRLSAYRTRHLLFLRFPCLTTLQPGLTYAARLLFRSRASAMETQRLVFIFFVSYQVLVRLLRALRYSYIQRLAAAVLATPFVPGTGAAAPLKGAAKKSPHPTAWQVYVLSTGVDLEFERELATSIRGLFLTYTIPCVLSALPSCPDARSRRLFSVQSLASSPKPAASARRRLGGTRTWSCSSASSSKTRRTAHRPWTASRSGRGSPSDASTRVRASAFVWRGGFFF